MRCNIALYIVCDPNFHLLVKFASSHKQLWVICDSQSIHSIFMLKQSSKKATLWSPFISFATRRFLNRVESTFILGNFIT